MYDITCVDDDVDVGVGVSSSCFELAAAYIPWQFSVIILLTGPLSAVFVRGSRDIITCKNVL